MIRRFDVVQSVVTVFLFVIYVYVFIRYRDITFELAVAIFYGFAFFGNVLEYPYIGVTLAGSGRDK